MTRINNNVIVLGAGVTGLAAGLSGFPVFEAAERPGGICSSYYCRPGESVRLDSRPRDGDAYRFEIGGGHWIFGGDSFVLNLLRNLTPLKTYPRKSSVYFPSSRMYVPYPLQNNLRYLDPALAARALQDMIQTDGHQATPRTMADSLRHQFGRTLSELFFEPFHELYTAGLAKSIAPQDAYKSPASLAQVLQGAFGNSAPAGYNVSLAYPRDGLDSLIRALASRCQVKYGKKVLAIDVDGKEVYFDDGSGARYDALISTLPLNRMMRMTGLECSVAPDPATSVLVVNIGGVRGHACPDDHWVYVPSSRSGFHRVGVYSNVDESFLPSRTARRRVAIYVEKAYHEGSGPTPQDMAAISDKVVAELQEWGWIEDAETVDPTWVAVAYTWSWPESQWKTEALTKLESYGIFQVGRYGRWAFQGLADSMRDGLLAAAAMAGACESRFSMEPVLDERAA